MALSVEKDIDRADTLYKQANRMQKRNPDAAKRLKAKAAKIENKAVGRLGHKVRSQGGKTNSLSGSKTTSLNWR